MPAFSELCTLSQKCSMLKLLLFNFWHSLNRLFAAFEKDLLTSSNKDEGTKEDFKTSNIDCEEFPLAMFTKHTV